MSRGGLGGRDVNRGTHHEVERHGGIPADELECGGSRAGSMRGRRAPGEVRPRLPPSLASTFPREHEPRNAREATGQEKSRPFALCHVGEVAEGLPKITSKIAHTRRPTNHHGGIGSLRAPARVRIERRAGPARAFSTRASVVLADTPFHQDLFEPGSPKDVPWRKITSEHVSVVEAAGRKVLKVEPEAIRLLAQEAMTDIAHLLRPGHLQQLANILKDPEASDNDRFVALELLKNANVAAGMVLPGCQDTGTAIVMGKRGQNVWTDGNDEEMISKASTIPT